MRYKSKKHKFNITQHFEPNTKGRDFVVGDIHGCYDNFDNELSKVAFDFNIDRCFSVGDLIDRGPKSLECLKLIQEPWFFANRGNHEDLMLESFRMPSLEHTYPGCWYRNGGQWAVEPDTQISSDLIELTTKLPLITVIHKADKSRVNIVHAEFPDFTTDEQIDDEDFVDYALTGLIWKRNRSQQLREVYTAGVEANYIAMDQNLSRTYCGHTPLKKVAKLGSYNFIDTGCVFGNFLTMVEI